HEQKSAVAATVAQTPAVNVIHPRVDSNMRTLTLPGSLQALEATAVYARATGYVRRWYVDIGDKVTQGQLLAEIDTPDLDQQLEQLKSFARITSPFAGTITERNIERGTLVTPGSAQGKPLYMIAISNPLRLFIKVPQTFASGIAAGAPVKVRVRQYPGRDFAGTITRDAGALDATTRTLTVEAQVANDKGELFPGAYSDVT